MKITFINPNTEQEVDKYLPKILAEAVINKVAREINEKKTEYDTDRQGKHSA